MDKEETVKVFIGTDKADNVGRRPNPRKIY